MIDKIRDIVGQNSAVREASIPVQPSPEALMEICCRVFAACLDLSPPHALFGSKLPLNSAVSIPSLPGLPDLSDIRDFSADREDEVDNESALFSDDTVDLSLSLLEEERRKSVRTRVSVGIPAGVPR